MNESLRKEWIDLLDRRRRYNASGQDGADFVTWLQCRGVLQEPVQMELFA